MVALTNHSVAVSSGGDRRTVSISLVRAQEIEAIDWLARQPLSDRAACVSMCGRNRNSREAGSNTAEASSVMKVTP